MLRDTVSRTANVGTVGKNGLITNKLSNLRVFLHQSTHTSSVDTNKNTYRYILLVYLCMGIIYIIIPENKKYEQQKNKIVQNI